MYYLIIRQHPEQAESILTPSVKSRPPLHHPEDSVYHVGIRVTLLARQLLRTRECKKALHISHRETRYKMFPVLFFISQQLTEEKESTRATAFSSRGRTAQLNGTG